MSDTDEVDQSEFVWYRFCQNTGMRVWNDGDCTWYVWQPDEEALPARVAVDELGNRYGDVEEIPQCLLHMVCYRPHAGDVQF